jgi:anti-sigma regulatory factor (Ser/Thr protein kinase)
VTVRLPFAAASVSVARQSLRDWMVANGASREAVEDARVIVSELVANSIRHARPLVDGQLLVTWRPVPRGVELSVTDGGGDTRPHAVQAPSSALAGRGMAIVSTLALDWWSERSPSRSTITALIAG